MLRRIAAAVLTCVATAAAPLRICYGDPAHPLASGEVWVVANRWGDYPGVLVATIRAGCLVPGPQTARPPHWNDASNYKLIVAVSKVAASPKATIKELGYEMDVAPFVAVYLSPPFLSEWQTALEALGTKDAGGALVLPPPHRRTFRLIYPDGRPLRYAKIPVELFGSGWNHCGGAAGIPLGAFTTDGDGRLTVVATPGPLAFLREYWIPRENGPANGAWELDTSVITGGADEPVVSRMWTLPEFEYLVNIRTRGGKPVRGVRLEACLWRFPCGAGCGPLPPSNGGLSTDANGQMRFRDEDLRRMGQVTAVDREGNRYTLTAPELATLLNDHRLTLLWTRRQTSF